MKITIKSTNLTLTPSLKTFINEKLGVLEALIKKIDQGDLAQLKIEVARTTRHHLKGDVFMAEGNLILPSQTLRAVEESDDIRRAIDVLKHTLKREIEKYKAKHLSFARNKKLTQ